MSEAYRKAMEAGDHTAAGRAIMDAVSGDYDSDAVHGLHRIARMTSTERGTEPAPELAPREWVRVTTHVYRNGSGA